ncbi:M48 family metalloprotease [Mesorhizobium sp. M0984]|uniref:M48 family metalloprotease n=1 Tax=Mesorhizobium sp. M0984 TaxID=2957041 RepID=UPI00333B1E07
MRLATSILGTETRVRPLVTALLAITALRVGWLAINIYEIYDPHVWSLAWALVPWPWPMGSWAVWTAELALVFYQARAALRLGRLLALRFTPRAAAFLGLSGRREGDHLTPRNRSWLPTALQLSGTLILTCCVAYWITLMLWFWEWCPFDPYMQGFYGQRALVAGVVLSLLGLTFGGRYIARASADVSTSFRVVSVGDDHWLAQRVHQLSDQLSLPRPAVGITNVLNAFAMGKNQRSSMVVIGTPLFEYEKDELDAVIGHELGHILHNDIARMTFAEGFQRMLVTVVDIITVVGAIMAAQDAKTPSDAQRNVRLVKGSGHLARKTVFIASELVTQGISRNREFHADVVGAHVTSPDAMARALKRVHGVAEKSTPEERHYGYLMFRGAGFGNLFATHPTLQARLTALGARQASRAPARPIADHAPADGPTGAGQRLAPVVSQAETISLARTKPATPAAIPPQRLPRIRAAVRIKANPKRLLMIGAACAVVAVATPAVVSFYGLDQRFEDARVAIAQASSASWAWLTGAGNRALAEAEYAERVRQLDVREKTVKAAEARLAATQQTARARLVAPSVDSAILAAVITERDKARALVNDMQGQIASTTQRLSTITADRDELARQNEALRQANEKLEGQVASHGNASDDDTILQHLQVRVVPPARPEGQANSDLPDSATGAQ